MANKRMNFKLLKTSLIMFEIFNNLCSTLKSIEHILGHLILIFNNHTNHKAMNLVTYHSTRKNMFMTFIIIIIIMYVPYLDTKQKVKKKPFS